MLDVSKIKAISFDLDDTLWPIWPTIERAEKALHDWLGFHAPMAAAMFSGSGALSEIRSEIGMTRPDLKSDLSALRRESIRLALQRAGENPQLAEPAFDVFFEERQRVTLFDDALATLDFLSARFPLVSVSNGNADVAKVGLAHYFRASISAREFGVGKPDPRIFLAAAGALDLVPQDVLHVGDDATLDGLGALNAGMQCAWLNRSDHLWPHETTPNLTVTGLEELCALWRQPA
ncbi:HAD family hydrolase [Caenimonas terrae]|uniref:HAD family hydrolase n=1 Tax=Caenimonas terrae TaxID=696074 RepID=A0ABW0NBW4_9BURK